MIALLALTQVLFVSAWTTTGLEQATNEKLQQLESSIDPELQTLTIRSIQMVPWDLYYYSIITYDINDLPQ
jgi:hypothetical protein